MSHERLQKVLAHAGIGSRRHCEQLIADGRITVNGQRICEPGTKVDLDHDTILVDGLPLRPVVERRYLMLNKPPGIISTAHDPWGRPTVLDLLPISERLFPVGRLDKDSQGLLLLTNDGALTHRLTHPSFEVEKEYHVLLNRLPTGDMLQEWRQGVMLDGKRTAPAEVEIMRRDGKGVWARVILREGRKRHIREVAAHLGLHVHQLIRVREGSLWLGDLPLGEWRDLLPHERHALLHDIAPPPSLSPAASTAPHTKRRIGKPSRRSRSSSS